MFCLLKKKKEKKGEILLRTIGSSLTYPRQRHQVWACCRLSLVTRQHRCNRTPQRTWTEASPPDDGRSALPTMGSQCSLEEKNIICQLLSSHCVEMNVRMCVCVGSPVRGCVLLTCGCVGYPRTMAPTQ